MREQECRIILALDIDSRAEALRLARLLRDEVALVKVGLQAFTACGPALIHDLRGLGVEVFLDLKLHDIPHTVGRAAAQAVRLGCSMLTLHTVGGLAMLRAAREHVDEVARGVGTALTQAAGCNGSDQSGSATAAAAGDARDSG